MISIVVVGSVNLDLAATVSRLPAAGETITGAELNRFPGGKGANQALAARRLGAKVQLVARTGSDANADEALALLREGGVDLSSCETGDEPTGVALICVAPSGENHIVVAPGANAMLLPEALQLPEADALICQLEIPEATIALAASQFSGFFCVNLAPAKRIDVTILQRADLVVVNETESAWYGDTLNACTGMIATTYGADGAELNKNGETIARAQSPVVNAVDTTGAGDTFTAALTVALVEGMSPNEALKFACAAGACATTRKGAQPSLPTRAEVQALL
jgi:ribokinase